MYVCMYVNSYVVTYVLDKCIVLGTYVVMTGVARLPRENGKAARRPCASCLMIGPKTAEPILA